MSNYYNVPVKMMPNSLKLDWQMHSVSNCSEMFALHFLILLLITQIQSDPKTFTIGGIFDENPEDEATFNFAIENLNLHKNLPDDPSLAPVVAILKPEDGPLQALQSTCNFFDQEVVAVFGPKKPNNLNIVQSACDDKEVPHLITRWTSAPPHQQVHYSNIINLYPDAQSLSAAYIDIVLASKWDTFTILYDDNESIVRMSQLIIQSKRQGVRVGVKQLDAEHNQNYRKSLSAVRLSGEKNFVIDCRYEILLEVLLQAQQIGLMTDQYNFFITNLDLQTVDMTQFRYCGANITGIRLFDPKSDMVQRLTSPILDYVMENHLPEAGLLKCDSALLLDAISMFYKTLKDVASVREFSVGHIGCNSKHTFRLGSTLVNIIRGSEHVGLTGLIKFDNEGARSVFNLEIIRLIEDGFEKIGGWNSSTGLKMHLLNGEDEEDDEAVLRGKNFTVITCLTDPYGMLKETAVQLIGNDRFEGFGIDLFYELAAIEGFNFTFIIREDKKNGAKDDKGEWSGMIGDVRSGKAHFAITDLTITAEREEAVDFTSPFMNLGISILGRKPKKAPPSFFSFADPFAIDTWIGLALAYILTSIALFVIGRLSPDEWNNPNPCIEEPEFLLNQFSFQNSIWFVIGSLMQQGTEIAPMSIATRMTAGMWWFFCLIMVSSYTANLAASLATENPIMLFEDVDTLVENMEKHQIKMGAKAGGATASFFKGKDNPTYQVIADYMKNHPEDMVSDNKDGVSLAENSTYAFFMESTSIEYMTQRHCDLQQYGGLLDEKGYGIAMKKNSKYRKKLSMAILQLQSSGQLDQLKRKWWEEKRGGGQCLGTVSSQEAEPLLLENVEGVFYVTIGGIICSIVCVILEMVVYTIKQSIRTKVSLRQAFNAETKAYLNFGTNVKAVAESVGSSPKISVQSDDNLKPEPYGFIITPSKENLTIDTVQ